MDAVTPERNALRWYLLMVRSNSEKKAATALHRKGYDVFLPVYRTRRQWSDRVKELEVPLFACHLFCRYPLADQMKVLSTPGIFFDIGQKQHPIPVDDSEITNLRKVLGSGFRVEPWPEPSRTTEMVWIRHEAFSGLEGSLVRNDETYRVIIGVEAVRAAVAVEVPKELIVFNARCSEIGRPGWGRRSRRSL